MKQTGLFIIAALIAFGLGIAARQYLPQGMIDGASTVPEFNLPDTNGNTHNVSEWRGKLLVINFWATWCPPCRKEIPDFIALQQQYADKGLQFVGIALEEKEPVVEYAAATKFNYPVLIGGNNGIALARQLGNAVDAVPYTIIADREGRIIYRHPGELSKEQLVGIITPLLN